MLEVFGEKSELKLMPLIMSREKRSPALMLNGKYDRNVNYEREPLPLYDLLGTPKDHKRLIAYDTNLIDPGNENIREILHWLDIYFELVSRK